jgi:tetratricopeptide (TPR) repeat protein
MRLACLLASACCLIASTPRLVAQNTMSMPNMPAMEDMVPVPPPDKLPVPIRMTGIGNGHITIKANAEAQAWFDQGINLLHDFWDYESAKAFEQSIRVDPTCPMCYWGLAQAQGFRGGPESAYGKKALAEAVRLKSHGSATDKLYIEAAEAASNAKDDKNTQEIETYRRLVKKEPKDLEARIFLANAMRDGYDDKGEARPGSREAIAILESVLRDAPNDSAANHYWIHAMEPSNHPERAIPSAERLASLAPTSGHMVHMPGHIFYRVGDYSHADRWFDASTTADEQYMNTQHVGPDEDWNYVHNMMYAIANRMEQGRLAGANALSDRLAGARGQLSATLYIWSARDQMSRISHRLPVALRVGDWDAVLAMTSQANLPQTDRTTNLRFLASTLETYAKGMKALESNDIATAQSASDRMDAALWRTHLREADMKDMDMAAKPKAGQADSAAQSAAKKDEPPMAPIMPDATSGPLVSALGIASQELRAGILVAQGKLPEAKKLYASAARDEKKAGYHEPPFYVRPVAETEAAALLAAKDYPGAKAAYEAALIERPNSGFELYGLARTAELSGDTAAARKAYQAFLAAWPAADPTLPELAAAHKALSTSALATQ